MRFPAIQEMLAYWEALRAGRPVPLRSEVDPRGIERGLDFAFMLERGADGVARFRIAGSHLDALMGEEARGLALTALAVPEARADLARIVQDVFAAPQTAELDMAADVGIGRPPIAARLLLLPVKSDGGVIDRALGCLCSHGPLGRAPRRFHLTGARLGPIALPAAAAAATSMATTAAPLREARPAAHPFADLARATPAGPPGPVLDGPFPAPDASARRHQAAGANDPAAPRARPGLRLVHSADRAD